MPLNWRTPVPPLPAPVPVPVLAASDVPVPVPREGAAVRAGRGAPPPLVVGRPGAGLVLVGRRADIDRRQIGGCNILRMRECCVEGKNRGGEKNRAMPPGGCGGGRHGSDLGMTSVARHSEPGPTIAQELWRS